MDAILAAAITEIQSVVSQQFNNERPETDLVGIDMTGSIDMTTEPVQDPEVPDFVGGMLWHDIIAQMIMSLRARGTCYACPIH